MQKISCIICAYNEAERLPGVLDALKNHPLIAETVVVNDGSTDNTAEILLRYPWVHAVSYPKNRGKSYALATGIKNAEHSLLLFLDADLIGFSANDVNLLVEPVLAGDADVSFSLRKNSYRICHFLGFDYLSGDRMITKTLVDGHVDAIAALPRFGVEAYVNQLIVSEKKRLISVPLLHVTNPQKTQKFGFIEGTKRQWGMVRDILKVISLSQVIRQHIAFTAQIQKRRVLSTLNTKISWKND